MGDKDLIKPLLEQHGQVHFGKVCPAMQCARVPHV